MPVTAKDIAQRLGVSQPTVSRVLSGTHGCRISPTTRQRVLDMAREMGYQPNAVARSLRCRQTNIVGFYSGYGCLDARNDFLAEIIGGLQRACDGYTLDLLLHSVHRGQSTDDLFGKLLDGRADGLFLHTTPDDPLVERLATSSLPVVAIADCLPQLPSVFCADAEGTRQLMEYLWQHGHRRIGYIAPTICFPSVERRREAFEAVMLERGQTEDKAPVYRVNMEETAPALDAILHAKEPPTAVCCWNDRTAYNLLRHCRERSLRVPEDLAVVGFDGFQDTKFPARRLVTVLAPWAEVTNIALELLVAQIRGEEVARATELPVTLLPGDTVSLLQ